MTTVYVTSEDPRFDYSPALRFGQRIVAVFPPGQVHLSPQVALRQAQQVLKEFSEDDYLVLAGDPVKIGICVAVAAQQAGTVQMLRFNRHTLDYIAVPVDFTSPLP